MHPEATSKRIIERSHVSDALAMFVKKKRLPWHTDPKRSRRKEESRAQGVRSFQYLEKLWHPDIQKEAKGHQGPHQMKKYVCQILFKVQDCCNHGIRK